MATDRPLPYRPKPPFPLTIHLHGRDTAHRPDKYRHRSPARSSPCPCDTIHGHHHSTAGQRSISGARNRKIMTAIQTITKASNVPINVMTPARQSTYVQRHRRGKKTRGQNDPIDYTPHIRSSYFDMRTFRRRILLLGNDFISINFTMGDRPAIAGILRTQLSLPMHLITICHQLCWANWATG